MIPRPGQKVRWDFLGQTGDTGTVLRVWPRKGPGRQPGGVRAMVEVKWDSNGHTGRVEDRKLKVLGRPVKTCKCGLAYSRPEWEGLALVGTQPSDTERLLITLELRNCRCGSTICIERRQRKAAA